MKFGKLEINPSTFPGVLDTATWNRESAIREITRLQGEWSAAYSSVTAGRPISTSEYAKVHRIAADGAALVMLAELSDHQKILLHCGAREADPVLGKPLVHGELADGTSFDAYPTDADVLHHLCQRLKLRNSPLALGQLPRLGIGTRMTTKVWPGIFAAMERRGFAANCIQNSVRELNLLDDLTEGRPPVRNYASGFGMIESGYTGSTFEGLWVAGVLSALEYPHHLRYGADADHIQVKRSDTELAQAKRLIRAARYYTFFTLDVADVLEYSPMSETEPSLESRSPGKAELSETIHYHSRSFRIGKQSYELDAQTVRKCIHKFWFSLEVLENLASYLSGIKAGTDFDLEFAFDEHPPEIAGPDCISSEAELLFVAREISRRGLPVSHLAPNFGAEKGQDYRIDDGLEGLKRRAEAMTEIAEDTGYLLDFHSADDFSAPTRRIIGAATKGKLHFKISPVLHFIFAQTVRDHYPEIFTQWWNDAFEYASAEAAGGSPVAASCLSDYSKRPDREPAPEHEIFREFFFAFPGRRDADGRFMNREMFYTLSETFYSDYQNRVAEHLTNISQDLFGA